MKKTLFTLVMMLVLALSFLVGAGLVSASDQINPGDFIVAEFNTAKLVRVTPDGVRTEIFSFAPLTWPTGVAIDSNGDFIVTESGARKLSRITPDGVRKVIFSFDDPRTTAHQVAIDSNGDFVVAEHAANKLSRITPDGVRTVIFSFAPGTVPLGVAIDSNGDFIVSEVGAGKLSRITPGGVRTEIFSFPGGTQAGPHQIAIDGNGDFIVPTAFTDKLFRVTPSGEGVVIFSFPEGTYPAAVAVDSNGDFIVTGGWPATGGYTDKLIRVTPDGVATIIFDFAPGTNPSGVAVVPQHYHCTVTSNADDGPDSLRWCIANLAPGGTIDFALPIPDTITLTSGELVIDKPMTISGPGVGWLAISGDDSSRVFRIDPGATGEVHIHGLAIEGGFAGRGAGILSRGKLRLTEVEIRNNETQGPLSSGGGVFNEGELVIESSTIHNNKATAFVESGYTEAGGGGIWNQGTLQLTNSTVSGNSVSCLRNGCCKGRMGGGILNWGSLTLRMSTLADNYTDMELGGGGIWNEGEARTSGTILAENRPDNCGRQPVQSEGYNLDSDYTCDFTGTGDLTTKAGLGPLQDNGGPTLTHALMRCSPAIDGVTDPGRCTVDTDQRGVTRPQGTFCDIGAYEYELEVAPPDLWTVEYRWGNPLPGYSFADWPVFESWMNVRIHNRSDFAAGNVCARVTGWPANTEVPDPDVFVWGIIPAWSSAWSVDTFTVRVDMAHPVDPCEGVIWRIEYDDAAGHRHVIEGVPQFPPGEGPCD